MIIVIFSCIQLNEGAEIKLITGLFSFQKQSQTAPSIPLKQDRYGLISIYSYSCLLQHGAFHVSDFDDVVILKSKGGILSKACDYIQELRQSNSRLGDELNNLERLRMDNQLLRQEVFIWNTEYTNEIAAYSFNVFFFCFSSFLPSMSQVILSFIFCLFFYTRWKIGNLRIRF